MREELWEGIRIEKSRLEKWVQKQDAVMVAIVAMKIEKLSQGIIEKKEGKRPIVSMTTVNLAGQKRNWEFSLVVSMLHMWWSKKAIDLPSGADKVINLVINGRSRMMGCCFEAVVSSPEKKKSIGKI